MIKYSQLVEEIGEAAIDDCRYCSSRYWEWEQEVAEPLLRDNGWDSVSWKMGEKDSFGPLTRYAVCKKAGDNNIYGFVYG